MGVGVRGKWKKTSTATIIADGKLCLLEIEFLLGVESICRELRRCFFFFFFFLGVSSFRVTNLIDVAALSNSFTSTGDVFLETLDFCLLMPTYVLHSPCGR